MQVTIPEARALSMEVLQSYGLPQASAAALSDHLIDAHLTGHTYAGLPRLLVLLHRIREIPEAERGVIEVTRRSPSTALVDGHGNLGYLACQRAIEVGIEMAQTQPLVMVGACNAHYSGRLGYYTDQAAQAGLVAFHTNSVAPMVAAPGASVATLGTNPICAAFPTSAGPVICDFTTAATTRGAIDLAAAVGEDLPPGLAVDKQGNPTTDPHAAQEGAILTWGGHKGFALSVMIAAFGILCGGDAVPSNFGNWGHFFLLVRPDAFLPPDQFEQRMDELVAAIRASSPSGRIPGDQTRVLRAQNLAAGVIEVPDEVIKALKDSIAGAE